MKTVFYLPIICCFLFYFSACKKKQTIQETEPVGSGTVSPVYDLSNCFGEIYFNETVVLGKGLANVAFFPVEARFYTAPMLDLQKNDADVGSVTINGITLRRFGGAFTQRYYSDTTRKLFSLPAFTLSTSGTATVSKFNFQYNGGSPTFGDTSAIPASVLRSEGINLVLKNITNADSVTFLLQRTYYENVKRKFSMKGSNEVKIEIPSQEISDVMGSSAEGTIRVIVFKKVLIRVGAKDYLVNSVREYLKPVMVTPF